MKEMNLLPVIIPGGCTSLIQPCDTTVNKPFKDHVKEVAAEHYNNNLDKWTEGKFTTLERRILMTQWVSTAWKRLACEKLTIIDSFVKAGIAVAADGSEDHLISIKGMENYRPGIDKGKNHLDPFVTLTDE
jgi:hypothetical protein